MLIPKVPIYEQSIDLPTGGGTVQGAVDAMKAREDLRKAMRVKRRTTIKEGNFLKSMA
jgi:large subunit ribosomal protein L54